MERTAPGAPFSLKVVPTGCAPLVMARVAVGRGMPRVQVSRHWRPVRARGRAAADGSVGPPCAACARNRPRRSRRGGARRMRPPCKRRPSLVPRRPRIARCSFVVCGRSRRTSVPRPDDRVQSKGLRRAADREGARGERRRARRRRRDAAAARHAAAAGERDLVPFCLVEMLLALMIHPAVRQLEILRARYTRVIGTSSGRQRASRR